MKPVKGANAVNSAKPVDAAQPQRIGADTGPWPLHAAAAARALEAQALQQHAPYALMERAGLAVARLARALAPAARQVEVWCGPGNNGGDGYVAARWLHTSGTAVLVCECGDPARLPADAAQARRQAVMAAVPMLGPGAAGDVAGNASASANAAAPAGITSPDLVIDALLGLGGARAPEGVLAEAIEQIAARRAAGATVLAIDLPSGLNPDTGQPLGAHVVQAHDTLSLLSLKPGLFTGRGRDLAGRTWFDDLGHPCQAAPGDAAAPTAWLVVPAGRTAWPHDSHKGRRGDVWVVGGAPGMTGAASLAARAALAAGAGRVYISVLAAAQAERGGGGLTIDADRPELMHRPFADAAALLLGAATAVVGCGGGDAVREHLPRLLAAAPRLVLDADALNHVAAASELMRLLAGRAGRGQATVLTPHPLEAARLLGCDSAAVQANRVAAATTLAERTAAVVLLKGSGTVLGAPGALPRINPSGNAALATAGTGDVLAGWLGGLWAQAPHANPLDVAAAAVWQHGHAADRARPDGGAAPLLALDLIDAMAHA